MAVDPLSRAFAALADPTRRAILDRLAAGDATLVELARPHAVSAQAIAKHLRVLEAAGLVTRTRSAQRRPAHLEPAALDLAATWIERYRAAAEARYRRLDALLDSLAEPRPPVAPEGASR